MKQKNKVANISIIFSVTSLIIAPIIMGPTAFILAIISIAKDEPKGLIALILSIILPLLSMIVGMILLYNLIM